MKLYVINLDRSSDRLCRLEKLFEQQQLELTRIAAVDAKTICDRDYEKLTAKKHLWPEPLTRGEVACFMSHRLALQHIVQGREAYGVIFEDDVALSPHAHMFLKDDCWIPCEADIVKIETQNKKVWLGPPTTIMNGFRLSCLKGTHIMAAAYIVSKRAAAYLVGKMEHACTPFDHFLFNFDYGIAADLKIYQLDPAIAVQAKLASTLEADRMRREHEKNKKRTLKQILQREILRIGTRSRTGLWGLKTNLATKEQWKRISFDKTE